MEAFLAVMLAAGFASGVHCVGMCGGIVAVFDGRSPTRVIPIIPVRSALEWRLRVAFNAGRISTYAAAGAAAGLLGGAAQAAGALAAQDALYVAANVMLVLVGLHLAGGGRLLARIEGVGTPLWRRLQPLAARLLPARAPLRAYVAGFIWGWLPCALVYAALAAAVFAGSPAQGALAMAAFGLGTLPFLLAAGWLAARLRPWRAAAGGIVLAFGVYGLAHAGSLGESIRRGLLCF